MKLDRNTNRGGHGKYALVNMRKLIPFLDMKSKSSEDEEIVEAFNLLVRNGIITLGNETPGDQFFVMKYKDRFTSAGLNGYADAIWDYYAELMHCPEMLERMVKQMRGEQLTDEERATATTHHEELKSIREYHSQIRDEARYAQTHGNRIPD